MNVIIFTVGLGFGLFAFSQIVYPLFFALPKAKRLKKENKLKKKIPIYDFLLGPIFWGLLLIGSVGLVLKYLANYQNAYFISLVTILIFVIAQIPKKNKGLEIDFTAVWKDYLKDA